MTLNSPGGRVLRPIAQLVLIQSGCRWACLIDNCITYHESVQRPYILRVPLDGNLIYSFYDTRYFPGGRVWRPIAQLVLIQSGYRWACLIDNCIKYQESGQQLLDFVLFLCNIEKSAIFANILWISFEYPLNINCTRLLNFGHFRLSWFSSHIDHIIRTMNATSKLCSTSRKYGVPKCGAIYQLYWRAIVHEIAFGVP